MKKYLFFIILSAVSFVTAIAQNVQSGLPVSLELNSEISSKTAKVGAPVRLTVSSDVYDSDDELVIPQGAQAYGEILYVKKRGGFGKPGKLTIGATYITLPNGKKIYIQTDPISAVGKKMVFGKCCAITSFWVWPIFVGLAVKGGYAVINSGTAVQAYTK